MRLASGAPSRLTQLYFAFTETTCRLSPTGCLSMEGISMTNIHKNAQWKVLKSGMEAGGYWIATSRLAETRDNGLFNWPIHLCHKPWVNFPLFREAFIAALDFHFPDYDRDALLRTFEEADYLVGRAEAYDHVAEEMFPGKMFWGMAEMRAVSAEVDRRETTIMGRP
jgi:hypothetical protein